MRHAYLAQQRYDFFERVWRVELLTARSARPHRLKHARRGNLVGVVARVGGLLPPNRLDERSQQAELAGAIRHEAAQSDVGDEGMFSASIPSVPSRSNSVSCRSAVSSIARLNDV